MVGKLLSKSVKIAIGSVGVLVVVVLLIGPLILAQVLDLDKRKPTFEKLFSDFLDRPITIEDLKVQFFPMPGVTGANVRLFQKDGKVMALSPEVHLMLDLKESWKTKKLQLAHLEFVKPDVTLRRYADRSVPLGEMIKDIIRKIKEAKKRPDYKPPPFVFRVFEVVDGDVTIIDEVLQKEPIDVGILVNAKGEIVPKDGKKIFPFTWASVWRRGKQKGNFDMDGVLGRPITVRFSSKKFPIRFLSDATDVARKMNGTLAFDGELTKEKGVVSWAVQGGSDDLALEIPDPIPTVAVSFDLGSNKKSELSVDVKTQRSHLVSSFTANEATEFEMSSVAGQIRGYDVHVKDLSHNITQIGDLVRGDTKREKPKPQDRPNYKANFDFKIDNLIHKEIVFEDLTFDIDRPGAGALDVNNLTSKLSGGDFQGQLKLRCQDPASTTSIKPNCQNLEWFAVDWNITEVDLDPIVRSLTEEQKFNGTGSTQGQLRGQLGQMAWEEMQGTVELQLRDGQIWNAPTLLKTFSHLNLTSLFNKWKKSTNDKDAIPFDIAEGKLEFKKGSVVIEEPAFVENETMKIGFIGGYSFKKDNIDGKVFLEFLGVVDEVINLVPFLKQIVWKGQKTWLPIWLEVTGPLKNPNVRTLPSRSVSKSIWGAVGGIISAPYNAIKGSVE